MILAEIGDAFQATALSGSLLLAIDRKSVV